MATSSLGTLSVTDPTIGLNVVIHTEFLSPCIAAADFHVGLFIKAVFVAKFQY